MITEGRKTHIAQNHAQGMTTLSSLVDRTKERYPSFPRNHFFYKISRVFRRILSCLAAMSETCLATSTSSAHRFGRLLNRLPDLRSMNEKPLFDLKNNELNFLSIFFRT